MADTLADIMHSKLAAKYPTLGPAASISDLLNQFVVDNPTYIKPLGSLPFYSATQFESLSDAAYRYWTAYAGGGGGGPFDPTGLAVWFDAADAASFTFESSNIVSQWNDKSVNALHMSYAAGTKPTRVAGVSNGLPAVMFPNTLMQHVSVNTGLFVNSGDMRSAMWFSVIVFDSDPLAGVAWLGCGASSGAVKMQLADPTSWSIFTSGVVNVGEGSSYFHAPDIPVLGKAYVWTYTKQGDADIVRRDQVDVPTDTGTATAGAMVPNVASFYLGVGNDQGNTFIGKIAEVICITRYDQTQRDGIETYLKTKWGTS